MEYSVLHKNVPCLGSLVALRDYKGFSNRKKQKGQIELRELVLNKAVFF